MNIKEFGRWTPYNASGDDPRYAADEYNRSFIKERYEVPGEYENSDFDEYYSVPGMTDTTYGQQKDSEKSDKDKKERAKRQLRQNMIRQVVVMAAGSVVITTSYQAAVRRQQAQPVGGVVQAAEQSDSADSASFTANWKWSEDNQTATLQLLDAKGNLIKEINATIIVSEEAATCNKEGTKTYTATASYKKETYSDKKEETLKPLGHDFDEGEKVILDNGQTATHFTCARCHEEFTIITSMKEND